MIPEFYCEKIPDWMEPFLSVPEMKRIRKVGMDCGCEYTSFERFRGIPPYSRYDHSLGCALIVWRFTESREQALSALFHDIATPVFAHTVDFLNGDHLRQESTEAGTEEMIRNSEEIMNLLSELGINTESVTDYHRYPVADNDAPKLSSDRLEYTLSNAVRYGFLSVSEAKDCFQDLSVFIHPDGTPELSFQHAGKARIFAYAALSCSKVYVSEEDRYAMQRLSELLRDAIQKGVLLKKDLYRTEEEIIQKIEEDEELSEAWRDFRSLSLMVQDPEDMPEDRKRIIPAKKRFIDPLAEGRRLSETDASFAEAIREYLNEPQDRPICGISRKEEVQ